MSPPRLFYYNRETLSRDVAIFGGKVNRNPSHDLAIEFVSGYWEKAPRTQDKYAAIIKGFMTYFGEPIDDLKIKRPSPLPEIVKDVDIDKFLEVVRNK
jgi:hypothetical protein